MSGLTTLKAFRADAAAQERMREQAERFRRATMRLLRMQLNSVTVMDLFTFGGAAVGICIVCATYARGGMSLAGALFAVLVAVEFFMPMRTLGSYFHTAMGASTVIDKIFDVLDAPDPEEGELEIDGEFAAIELKDVGFAYRGAQSRALAGVELAVDAGSFAGVTGESGSGKSTLARVIAGECVACGRCADSCPVGNVTCGIELRADAAPEKRGGLRDLATSRVVSVLWKAVLLLALLWLLKATRFLPMLFD